MRKRPVTKRLGALTLTLFLLFGLILVPSVFADNEEWKEVETYVFEAIPDWVPSLTVSEYTLRETLVMHVYVVLAPHEGIDILEAKGFWDSFDKMLENPAFPHERIHVDVVTHLGERLRSLDILVDGLETTAVDFVDEDEPEDMDPDDEDVGVDSPPVTTSNVVQLNQPFKVSGMEITVRSFQYVEAQLPAIQIYFDAKNLSEFQRVAGGDMIFTAEQNGVELEQINTLDNSETTFNVIDPNATMKDCLIGFYTIRDLEPVDIFFHNQERTVRIKFTAVLDND